MDSIVSSSRFFVYLYSRNCIPFYVGKGSGERINAHFMCAHKHQTCKHRTCRIIRKAEREGEEITAVKIADGISEQAAFKLEQLFISYGVVYGWPLVNQTIGGEGVSGYQRTPEQRAERKRLAQQLATEGKFEHLKTVNLGRQHTPEIEELRRQHVSEAWANPGLVEQQRQQVKLRWQSSEFREKQQQGMHNPEIRDKLAYWKGKESAQAKTYPGFVAPDGSIYENVRNLTRFCRQHDLQVSGMCLVAQGKQPSHKGWTRYIPELSQPKLL